MQPFAIVDSVSVPVFATGGIADGRGIAASITIGASAVQIGTGFLRTSEAGIPPAWSDVIGTTMPNHTILTRTFSGRLGRSIATDYAKAAVSVNASDRAWLLCDRHAFQAPIDTAGRIFFTLALRVRLGIRPVVTRRTHSCERVTES